MHMALGPGRAVGESRTGSWKLSAHITCRWKDPVRANDGRSFGYPRGLGFQSAFKLLSECYRSQESCRSLVLSVLQHSLRTMGSEARHLLGLEALQPSRTTVLTAVVCAFALCWVGSLGS